MMRELIVDSFACGGGTSEGIKLALGRSPDIAVNHDRIALAMYRANHPETRVMLQDVATVDAVGMCGGRPIGMLWMSPDCTDHSKAKGAAPRRDGETTTRGIGWAIYGWVKRLPKWQRPRVVFLENVEEYVDWSPLLPNGKRNPKRKGETFKLFVEAWRALGFTQIEWRFRRGWWSGSATIRRRLFMVMRSDGEPIVWPERTHGNPNVPEDAARIAAGELKVWPIIANCVDFSRPIPSVLDSKAEIKAKLGLNAKRPLVPNTERRLCKGVEKRVLRRKPFMVLIGQAGGDAIVTPFGAWQHQAGGTRDVDAPGQTFTASPKDQNMIVAPYLVPRYGERAGQEPRHLGCDAPGPTAVPDGNEGSLVAVSICREFGRSIGSGADEPVSAITAGGGGKASLVAAFMAQHSEGSHPGQPSHSMEEPSSTITVRGTQQGVVACSMLTMRGSERRTAGADEPGRTISAGGSHSAVVTMPLMTVYYGTDEVGGACDEPSRTDTAKARFGLAAALARVPPFGPEHADKARRVADLLRKYECWDEREFVTVEVEGFSLVLTDLCMRMLTPRERYNAMGFPPDYIIDHGIDADGSIIRFTLEQQGAMCGNAVCPSEARDLVAANYQPRERQRPGKPAEPLPFFMEAAE